MIYYFIVLVCATVDSQCLEYLGYITLHNPKEKLKKAATNPLSCIVSPSCVVCLPSDIASSNANLRPTSCVSRRLQS